MTIHVSDTSVLIDLERGGFLEAAFALPFELAVPDLLYERELKNYGGERLIELGLRVEELDAEALGRALGYRTRRPALSIADSFALALGWQRKWTLLAGDRDLRELAEEEKVECHGVLWMLDQMNNRGVVAAQALYAGLQAIAQHPRCRLPKREIRVRLERYQAVIHQSRE